MYIGKSYSLPEFIFWTRKKIYILIIIGILPVVLYQYLNIKWLAISWTVVTLLGTATAFIVAFKNTQTYNRTVDAQHVWTAILNSSRSWGIVSRDFINDNDITATLINRHLAWITALRYEMRTYRTWETTQKKPNAEYQKYYSVPEWETPLEKELSKYLDDQELQQILQKKNKATQILALQSNTLKELYDSEKIVVAQFLDMQRSVKEFYGFQGQSEQIKDSPYPRQYAIINTLLVRLFCFLLPFGLLQEFDKLNNSVEGIMKGNMILLVIPFSVVISWIYTSLGQVGESTENPFEGSPNDVPISQISRIIEIDLKEMMGEKTLPPFLKPYHDIIL